MRFLLAFLSLFFIGNLLGAETHPANQDIYVGVGDILSFSSYPDLGGNVALVGPTDSSLILGYEHRLFESQSWILQGRFSNSDFFGSIVGGDIGWRYYFTRKRSLLGPFFGIIFELANETLDISNRDPAYVGNDYHPSGTLYGPGIQVGDQWNAGRHLVINAAAVVRILFNDLGISSEYNEAGYYGALTPGEASWIGLQVTLGWKP